MKKLEQSKGIRRGRSQLKGRAGSGKGSLPKKVTAGHRPEGGQVGKHKDGWEKSILCRWSCMYKGPEVGLTLRSEEQQGGLCGRSVVGDEGGPVGATSYGACKLTPSQCPPVFSFPPRYSFQGPLHWGRCLVCECPQPCHSLLPGCVLPTPALPCQVP